MFSCISHDLKTPLNSVNAVTESLLGKHWEDKEEVELLQIQRAGCEYIRCLIDDIIHFAKIEISHGELDSEEFDLTQDLLQEIETLFKPLVI